MLQFRNKYVPTLNIKTYDLSSEIIVCILDLNAFTLQIDDILKEYYSN